ncbi:serine hydrolase domain-containing protein [Actinomycetospora termitidis]|uniref:Serine hydrolase domain-containing protein n=1 Tax=Actinomycetospora termitidis TaxID=3053470 RepID=A0ABT7M188_9PSEU|nr:serine hydrolase domain-containing protein [Actinomycetospora sp. Odt1-22]MDL5154418.1 serine hydrolase domain-containing protein [Actinomycetospora sp. Odt1-22]
MLDSTAYALTHRLAVEQSRGRAPSMAGAVLRGREIVWTGARGEVDGAPPTDDTQYRIGSITKTVVAILVMRLRDEGRLDLDDRLGDHLTDTPVPDATIAQLLAHSSGLPSETGAPWWERSDGAVRPDLCSLVAEPPLRAPGRRHHYSNVGFGLLGALVGRMRGHDWFTAATREVLEPLGMTRTTYAPTAPHAQGWAVHPWADLLHPEPAHDAGLMAPAGQLWSTTTDLARFGDLLLHGDDRVLSAASVEEMRRPSAPSEAGDADHSQGLGLQLLRHGGRALAGHTGSMPGFVATLWVDPAEDLAAVAFANATSGPAIGACVGDLIGIVAEREPRLPEPWRPAVVNAEVRELLGPWYWGASPVALRLRGADELTIGGLGGGARTSRFRPGPDGTWLGLDGYYAGETLRAVRRDDGSLSHLDLGSFVFTREPYAPGDVIPGGVPDDGWG